MCSGCSGGYQDDYEDPDGDDLDQENPSGTAGPALDNPIDGPANSPERVDGEQVERFRDFGTGDDRPRRIVRPFEEGYEVLVGADRILEIRIVRAKHLEFGGLPTEESPSRRHIVGEKSHKHYQTYAIGYPPYHRPPEQGLIKLLMGLFIRFCFWGLAAFSVGTLAAWVFLR